MTELIRDDIEVRDGVLVGPLRQSVNNARQSRGSIHDDETASKLGFRGGTVAGSIHMELFPPVLVQAFGKQWFEDGSLSLNFLNATTDRETVRAFVRQPPLGASDVQVDVWAERDDGMKVAEGTASVGSPDTPTALFARDLNRYEPGELRILAGAKRGDVLDAQTVRLEPDAQQARKRVITEPLDWYWDSSPWGGPIATPATMVQLLYARPAAQIRGRGAQGAVGLFGAIELRNWNGPVLVDRDYTVSGEIAAVGQSPKTEYVWFDSALTEPETGRKVATMRMQLRWMKASSPLYADA